MEKSKIHIWVTWNIEELTPKRISPELPEDGLKNQVSTVLLRKSKVRAENLEFLSP
jgi:hypothetical protein